MTSENYSPGLTLGYARVSTLDQNENLQRDALTTAGCDRLYVDKASGKLGPRPALDSMLDQLRAGDAQRWLDEVTTSIVTGQYVNPATGRVTLADFYSAWAARQVWESTTVKAVDLAVRSTTFMDVPLSRLRRSHEEAWIKSMDGAGLAPGTIKTRLINMRSVLRAAVRDRVIPSDPSDGLSGPRGRRPRARMSIPNPEQVVTLMGAIDPRYNALVPVAAFAGLRLGEAAGLQIGDIDFLRRQFRWSARCSERRGQRRGAGAKIRGRAHRLPAVRPGCAPLATRSHVSGWIRPHMMVVRDRLRAATAPEHHRPCLAHRPPTGWDH
jgi:hypothetical protein